MTDVYKTFASGKVGHRWNERADITAKTNLVYLPHLQVHLGSVYGSGTIEAGVAIFFLIANVTLTYLQVSLVDAGSTIGGLLSLSGSLSCFSCLHNVVHVGHHYCQGRPEADGRAQGLLQAQRQENGIE